MSVKLTGEGGGGGLSDWLVGLGGEKTVSYQQHLTTV